MCGGGGVRVCACACVRACVVCVCVRACVRVCVTATKAKTARHPVPHGEVAPW